MQDISFATDRLTADLSEVSELVKCPGCANTHVPLEANRTHYSSISRQRYALLECPACHLQYWNPRYVEATWYVNDDFGLYESMHAGKETLLQRHRAFFSYFPLKDLERARPLRLLDIGCGDGAFLEECNRWGMGTSGIDMDARSVHCAQTVRNLQNVERATLQQYASGKGTDTEYDVVTFFEVLEHQPSPSEFLSEVLRLVAPGGYIAGTVPNRERYLPEIERTRDVGDLPPHHFNWFSTSSVVKCLTAAGYVEPFTTATGSLEYSPKRIFAEIARRVTGNEHLFIEARSCGARVAQASSKGFLLRAASFLVVAALLPLALTYGGRGETLFFFARRPARAAA